MDQNQRQFLAETEDLIEQIFADLDELRQKREESKVRRELIDGIFRRIHRVKGSAASFGLEGLKQIAHEFESLLSAVRTGQTGVDDDVLDTCESVTCALAESLHLASSGVIEPSRRALFERIQTLAQGNTLTTDFDADAILKNLPSEIWQSLTDDEQRLLIQVVGEGKDLSVVAISFDIANFDDQFTSLVKLLAEHGEVIATSPTIDSEHSDRINFRVLFASNSDLQVGDADFSNFPGLAITKVAGGEKQPTSAETESLVAGLRLTPAFSRSNFIRTDLDELDSLISSTHELFRTTARVLDLALSQTQGGKRVRRELKKLDEEVRQSFRGVENELINLRMVSLGPVLQRAARAGRAVARSSNKEIDFEIAGANLRLDRLLCDAIADPLIHLVRNAVDHGIETGRQGVGSSERMRVVRIEAIKHGTQTCVRVIDNGRGVDPELVTRAAIRLGLIEKDSVVDMERSLRLIFRPGFTTLPSPSTISGRGVGLDVVETAVEQVGGELRVSSEPGQGSTFEIRLPATFGLLRAIVVVSGSNRYCIDSSEVVKVETASNRETVEKEGFRSGDDMLPLVRLRSLLGQSPDDNAVLDGMPPDRTILTCELTEAPARKTNGSRRVAIVVDRVQGTEEVLVRSLGRHAARWPGIAGATELRDGTVALVLDLPRLLSSSV